MATGGAKLEWESSSDEFCERFRIERENPLTPARKFSHAVRNISHSTEGRSPLASWVTRLYKERIPHESPRQPLNTAAEAAAP